MIGELIKISRVHAMRVYEFPVLMTVIPKLSTSVLQERQGNKAKRVCYSRKQERKDNGYTE